MQNTAVYLNPLNLSNSGEAKANKRVVYFSYKNINSSYNHDKKSIYLMVFNFFVGACAPTVLYVASPLLSNQTKDWNDSDPQTKHDTRFIPTLETGVYPTHPTLS